MSDLTDILSTLDELRGAAGYAEGEAQRAQDQAEQAASLAEDAKIEIEAVAQSLENLFDELQEYQAQNEEAINKLIAIQNIIWS